MRYRTRFDFGWICALMGGAILMLSSCGGGGGSTNNNSPPLAPSPSLALLAGNVGGPGNVDGVGAVARFFYPHGIAIDSLSNLFVADTFNNLIRKVTPAGVATTIAGSTNVFGTADGVGTSASFVSPKAIAVDGADSVYVGDWNTHTVRRISPAGVVTTVAGKAGDCGGIDGPVAIATFCFIEGIATDANGNVFVSSGSAIRKISPSGMVSTLAGTHLGIGSTDGSGPNAQFSTPMGLATDASGNVLVADAFNRTIRRVTPDGMVTTVAGMAGVSGNADGPATSASFNFPRGVGTDRAGNIYVADAGPGAHLIRRISPAGVVTTIAGAVGQFGSADGMGTTAQFAGPTGVVADGAGNLFVTDTENNTIRRITPSGAVTTLAGNAEGGGSVDGVGALAKFNAPQGVVVDSGGNVYVGEGRFYYKGGGAGGTIRKISPSGVATTLAGNASSGYIGDGVGRLAGFGGPNGLAIDKAGNIYAGDTGPSFPGAPRFAAIRRITPDGAVTTFAGSATSGSADGLGAAASFSQPSGMAFDSAGNLYVADSPNYTIRKIDPSGMVTTLAGLAGSRGAVDGPGSAARFRWPTGIAIDTAGNIYVTDSRPLGDVNEGDVRTIRKITPAGVVTTIDPGEAGRSNDALAIDAEGNLYVADELNFTIRKRTPAGVVTTVVGVPGQSTFEPGPLPGRISAPRGLAISGTDLYFTLGNGVAVVHNRP